MNKKGFEMNFAWLFAIIVGAVIIFIAIFATSSLIKTSRTEADSKVAAQLGILLNPVETNLEDAKKATITFPDETRFYNGCREAGNFGRQGISTAVRSGLGEEWQEPGAESSFYNKYIFSESVEEGERLEILVKPFEMPYKVADLIFLTSESYCFVDPPSEIEDEVVSLALENINVTSSVASCPAGYVKVCFANTGCDIDVNIQSGLVIKGDQELYFEGPLIYGAIFSDSEIYECQIKRLMKRSGELAHLYAEKTDFLTGRGCSSNLGEDLRIFSAITGRVNNSQEFVISVVPAAEEIGRKNENLVCKLF